MLLAAAALLNIDLGASFMVGDRASDIEAGCTARYSSISAMSNQSRLGVPFGFGRSGKRPMRY
jgi:histidinol phosphatase-like enzyme